MSDIRSVGDKVRAIRELVHQAHTERHDIYERHTAPFEGTFDLPTPAFDHLLAVLRSTDALGALNHALQLGNNLSLSIRKPKEWESTQKKNTSAWSFKPAEPTYPNERVTATIEDGATEFDLEGGTWKVADIPDLIKLLKAVQDTHDYYDGKEHS